MPAYLLPNLNVNVCLAINLHWISGAPPNLGAGGRFDDLISPQMLLNMYFAISIDPPPCVQQS
jgi:hypothetical protein